MNDRYALLQSAMASSERIFELLDTSVESAGGLAGEPPPSVGGTIEFRNVSFKYDPEATDYILKDVSFSVEAGQSLAIVGATGSGKTTIVNLLCRFYDAQKGAVLVDGRDVRDWNVEDLRRRVSIVQQDVFLFSGTIGSNISLGNADISGPALEQAAEHVNADRFINRLPGRYGHEVAERGSTLSAGERQLLSFARALAFDPEILILDEATSSIDTATEQLIQEAVSRLMKERTSIVIAHRLSTIRNADNILVLHHGEIRERGRHDQLMKQDGIYARLYQLNYRNQAERPD
jgi:ATP-binding cassette subfamily B multidrug efflux pump